MGWWRAHGLRLPDGPVFLLTHLRYLGYCFNPVSFFYCFDRGGQIRLMLAAVSNKDFIGETLDAAQPDRLPGTLAAVVFCILHGARIVRVHDVAATVGAVRMTEAILGWRPPAYTRHNV